MQAGQVDAGQHRAQRPARVAPQQFDRGEVQGGHHGEDHGVAVALSVLGGGEERQHRLHGEQSGELGSTQMAREAVGRRDGRDESEEDAGVDQHIARPETEDVERVGGIAVEQHQEQPDGGQCLRGRVEGLAGEQQRQRQQDQRRHYDHRGPAADRRGAESQPGHHDAGDGQQQRSEDQQGAVRPRHGLVVDPLVRHRGGGRALRLLGRGLGRRPRVHGRWWRRSGGRGGHPYGLAVLDRDRTPQCGAQLLRPISQRRPFGRVRGERREPSIQDGERGRLRIVGTAAPPAAVGLLGSTSACGTWVGVHANTVPSSPVLGAPRRTVAA